MQFPLGHLNAGRFDEPVRGRHGLSTLGLHRDQPVQVEPATRDQGRTGVSYRYVHTYQHVFSGLRSG
jgi:hypothetical protein